MLNIFNIFTNLWTYYVMVAAFCAGVMFYACADELPHSNALDYVGIAISAILWPVVLLYIIIENKYRR